MSAQRRETYREVTMVRRTRLVWNVAEVVSTALVGLVVAAIVVMFILVAEAKEPDRLPPLDVAYSPSVSQVGTVHGEAIDTTGEGR